MKNDFKLINCGRCGDMQQHYLCWHCSEYSLCLGCSKSGRTVQCKCEGQKKNIPEPESRNDTSRINDTIYRDHDLPTILLPKNNNRDQ